VTSSEWVWSIGGVILTGENRSTWRKTYLGATVSTISVTRTDMGLNPGLCSQSMATNHLNHGTLQCKAIIFSERALQFTWIVKNGTHNSFRTFTVWEGSFLWHLHWLIFHWMAVTLQVLQHEKQKAGWPLHYGVSYSLDCKYFSVKIKSFDIVFYE
jgi:hypothetical protein